MRSFLAPPRPGHGHAHKSPMRPAPPSSIVAFYSRPPTSPAATEEPQAGAGATLRFGAGQEARAAAVSSSSRALRAGETEGRRAGWAEEEPLFGPEEPSVRVMLVADMGQAEEDGSNAMLGVRGA